MEYIYPPLYKYLALILIFFMFIRHYKSIDQESYLLLCFVFLVMAVMMDYYLIEYHPNPLKTQQDESLTDFIIDDSEETPENVKNSENDESIVDDLELLI